MTTAEQYAATAEAIRAEMIARGFRNGTVHLTLIAAGWREPYWSATAWTGHGSVHIDGNADTPEQAFAALRCALASHCAWTADDVAATLGLGSAA